MLLKNATIHDGLGHIQVGDVLVEDGKILRVAASIDGEGEDLTGLHLLPGFIDGYSVWGINGSTTEIKPSSMDNDERSDPVTPELDIIYAFNGRAMSVQQLPAYGITAAAVFPSDNNVFGGKGAAFVTRGVNPMTMCLKEQLGMKASVSREPKKVYGQRSVSPMTRMRIFQMLESTLRKAAEYDPNKEGAARDDKLAALKPVLCGEMPLWIACDSAEDRRSVMAILRPYPSVRVVFTSIAGMDDSDLLLDPGRVAFVSGFAAMDCDPRCMNRRYDVLVKLMAKGVRVVLSSLTGGTHSREWLLWEGMELLKELGDRERVLSAMTSDTAGLLGIGDVTGSIEPGKRADLVIWSADPLGDFRARVLRTMIAGETVYREGDAIQCYI